METVGAAHASASLYVGNLLADVTEAMLFEIFNKVGPVASIRVCRDAVTRRSLGYAYINFFQLADAERALDTLNYTPIKGRQCRIMWVQRDPSLRKSGVGNIFIKNLDKSIDNRTLHDTFSAFGNILSCKVVTDENGLSRGYGFVHYETAEASEKAIQKVNGMLISGKKVFVGHHVSKKERESKAEEMKKNFTNVFVKNLDETVDDSEILALFSEFGVVTSCVIAKDESDKSKGFGFVNFRDHDAALKAVEGLHEKELKSKKLYVSRAQKKSERLEELQRKYESIKQERMNKYQGVNLYVKNLDDAIDSERLRQEFAAFGTITSHKIVTDDKNNSRGFGFVCFSSPEEATKAVTELNGRMLGSKPLFVALAQRKEIRRQHLAAQYQQRLIASQSGSFPPGMYGGPQVYYAQNPAAVMQAPRGQGYYPMVSRPPRWAPQQQQAGRPNQYPGVPGPMYAPNMSIRPNRQNRAPRTGVPPGGPQPALPGAPSGAIAALPLNGTQNAAGARPPIPQSVQPMITPQQQQRGRANFKYTSNVRNRIDAPISGAAGLHGQDPLTAERLADMTQEDQKRSLGDRIFMQVQPQQPDLAGKITGMLLDLDNSELLHLLEHPQFLEQKVQEAISVLEQHSKAQGSDGQ
jgi:polyadenylate-binding protein